MKIAFLHGISRDVAALRRVLSATGLVAISLSSRPAHAGCGDGACGRVDWTEVTESQQGKAVAAKLHGAFAWESSPDGWATHPLGGTLSGYVWLSCVPPSGPVESTCTDQLASQMAKAGTTTPLTFGGISFYDATGAKPIVPAWLFAESAAGTSTYLPTFPAGFNPQNQSVCATALASPGRDAGAPSDAGSDASPLDAGARSTGGTAGGSADGGGIIFGGGPNSGGAGGNEPGTGTGGAGGSVTAPASPGGAGSSSKSTGGTSDTGGGAAAENAASDAGGGCGIASDTRRSGGVSWALALALGAVALRRARAVRKSSP